MTFKTIIATCMLTASVAIPSLHAQHSLGRFEFGGEYATEWQMNFHGKTNWVNLLRLEGSYSPWRGGQFQVATLSVAKTGETIIDDWQTFSNLEDENAVLMLAVLGYMHSWEHAHLFLGVRNVNEDYFTSDLTSLFTNSSPGIFPTIAASYPIANYPLSGLGVHFDYSWKDHWMVKGSLYNGRGYKGWTSDDNPFLVKPGVDGVFGMAELSYVWERGSYYAGVSLDSKRYSGEAVVASKTSCAWYVYGEQNVWRGEDQDLSLMVQYSENAHKHNDCTRYAELGCVYRYKDNQVGASGQMAEFAQGREWSLELTWLREFGEHFAVQPAFQFIRNGNSAEGRDNYTVACARLYYTF